MAIYTYLLRVIEQFKLVADGGCCGGQKTCCLHTGGSSKQHEAARRVPTDMMFSKRVEMVRSGPDTTAECGAGVLCLRVLSSTGSEAGLGVAISGPRQ